MKVYESTNKRYKLAELDTNYYLIDMDSNILAYFLPTFVWFFPFRAVEIDKGEFSKLVSNGPKEYNIMTSVVISMFVGRPVYKLSTIFFQELDVTSEVDKRAIYLLITFGCLLIFRSIVMFYNKYKLRKRLSETGCNVIIEIDKGSITTYYKKNSIIRLILILLIAAGIIYITIFYLFDLILVFILGVLIFIFMNRSCLFPYGSRFRIKD
ncbi:hypothetical protein A5821_000082 [Enterococcus sp. 7F3_DIV0205]|uniref:Tandem five-TM protein n=1 Tax=Candidatus Enterococcus palustris TaxID=1834189 RepID=A0AAQ3Y4G7_9ENTE|nr:DUF443 family protein [Enterococcus sp. 7F3_DIV0205]OTN84488.1 hypothetical protein A5821_000416 [Enterococcus sp. 7F3_DIV0205]